MNLFKDRYYIPKEAGWMVLLAYFLAKTPKSNYLPYRTFLPFTVLIFVNLALLVLNTKRTLFALHPTRNYHHWLLADERIRNSPLPKIYAGDHLYFPNNWR